MWKVSESLKKTNVEEDARPDESFESSLIKGTKKSQEERDDDHLVGDPLQ